MDGESGELRLRMMPQSVNSFSQARSSFRLRCRFFPPRTKITANQNTSQFFSSRLKTHTLYLYIYLSLRGVCLWKQFMHPCYVICQMSLVVLLPCVLRQCLIEAVVRRIFKDSPSKCRCFWRAGKFTGVGGNGKVGYGKEAAEIQIVITRTGGRGEPSRGDAFASLPDSEGSPQHPAKRVLGTGREARCSPV